MLFRAFIFVLFAAAALGATERLYLKDGTYQITNDYQVQKDRVRYYSTERGEWEEIPLEMVDLDRTKKEIADHDEELKKDAQEQSEEDAAVRAARKEVESIPIEPGVYFIHGDKLETMKVAESKIVTDKKRAVLARMSPIPIIPGKATVELDGPSSARRIEGNRPEFYFRLSTEERFGIIRLTPKKTARVAENVAILPGTKEIAEDQELIDTFKKQEGDLLFKIWPEKPLEPGEYAVIEFTEGKLQPQIWDFGVGPAH